MKKRFLSMVMALIMVIGLLPISSMADELDNIGTDIPSPLSDEYRETYIRKSSYANTAKLYSFSDGVKGGEDFLTDIVPDGNKYTVELADGDYILEEYSGESGDNFIGSIVLTVSEDAYDFNAPAVKMNATNEGWVLGTDYTISAVVKSQAGIERDIVMGTYSGLPSCLCLRGDTIVVTFSPTDAHPKYLPAVKTDTILEDDTIQSTINSGIYVTINAPAGSEISFGTGASYSGHKFSNPDSVTEDESGVTAVFKVAADTDAFYRVQNPNGVTYWNFGSWSEDTSLTVTGEDLFIGSDEFTSKTVYHNFEYNSLDVADIYLNINEKGYLSLEVGDTYNIVTNRNWQAIENYMNKEIALPDMHYQVIDVNGNPSDVVTVVAGEPNSRYATLTANKEGTAIVLVTYDAMTHANGMDGTRFSAIWPENTGVFVVSVGSDGSAIATNMTINEGLNTSEGKVAVDNIDAEHDVLYYVGNDGASYSFTPESGCSVTVMRPVLTSSAMTYSGGFTSEGVSVSESGEVTVSGLMHGTNIVKVTKDGVSTYQVIRAKQAVVTVTDSAGNPITSETAVNPGDKITIQYDGVYNPAEKLCGVYNFTPRIYVVDDEGAYTFKGGQGSMGVYTFGVSKKTITVTVSQFWPYDSITYNGGLNITAYGQAVGRHRVMANAGADLSAKYREAYLGMLPAVTISVNKTDGLVKCTIKSFDGENEVKNVEYTVTNADGDSITFRSGTFSVLPGEYTVRASAEGYVLLRDVAITVPDTGADFELNLTKAGENPWDGETAVEPEKDENGIWQISTARELAWYANECNNGNLDANSKNAVLTADIELAGYEFTYIKTLGNSTFDGQGHSINNLYLYIYNPSVTGSIPVGFGFFGRVDDGSIKNLTLNGEMVFYKKTANPGTKICVGSVVGLIYAERKSTVERNIVNCTSNVDVTVQGKTGGYYYVGGIIGCCGATGNGVSYGAPMNISGNTNNGNLNVLTESTSGGTKCVSMVGGIAGTATERAVIDNCVNNGDIEVTSGMMVGGIVGESNGHNGALGLGNNIISNSVNRGKIDANVKNYTGGIAGLASETDIINSCNEGELIIDSIKGDTAWVGGLAGKTVNSKVESCANKGNVTVTLNVSKANVGGLIGSDSNAIDSDATTNISLSYNSGDVETKGTTKYLYAGGFIGSHGIGSSVINCYNTGDLKNSATHEEEKGWGNYGFGGMIGFQISGNVENCYSYGSSFDEAFCTDYWEIWQEESSSVKNSYFLNTSSSKNTSVAVSKTADEFADGTVLALLGEAFVQRLGIDPYPVFQSVIDEEAANKVEDLIDAIGEVTLDSGEAITAARNAYDALTEDQKALVENYNTLVLDEAKLKKLKADRDAADAVEDLIDAIGEVTLESGETIKAAQDAYVALSNEQKELVSNYKVLTDAILKYSDLVKAAEDEAAANKVEDLISAIGDVTLDSEEAIKEARDAYDALTEDQKSLVDNYDVLVAAEKSLAFLQNRGSVTIEIGDNSSDSNVGEENPNTGAPVLNLGMLAVLCGAALPIKFNRQ